MLKAIHAQESKKVAREEAKVVVENFVHEAERGRQDGRGRH